MQHPMQCYLTVWLLLILHDQHQKRPEKYQEVNDIKGGKGSVLRNKREQMKRKEVHNSTKLQEQDNNTFPQECYPCRCPIVCEKCYMPLIFEKVGQILRIHIGLGLQNYS